MIRSDAWLREILKVEDAAAAEMLKTVPHVDLSGLDAVRILDKEADASFFPWAECSISIKVNELSVIAAIKRVPKAWFVMAWIKTASKIPTVAAQFKLDGSGFTEPQRTDCSLHIGRGTMHTIASAMRYLASRPTRFVEVVPRKSLSQKAATLIGKKVPSAELSSIIPLTPDIAKIRHGMPTGLGTHDAPRGHNRRGHNRLYQHERYINVRWRTRFIQETWVGPNEWTFRGQVFRVLDLSTSLADTLKESLG